MKKFGLFWEKAKTTMMKNGLFYLIGVILLLALKSYYSRAGSDDLVWILAPTAWWVHFLSGIPFERVPDVGYVNHFYQFIIAPACAGLNFMVIALATLWFCFLPRLETVRAKLAWMAVCLPVVYFFTVLINSLRIIPSIYLLQMNLYSGWITPERVHTAEGTLVYFASLLFLTAIADRIVPAPASGITKRTPAGIKWLPPVCIYFGVTLGIPLLNGALVHDTGNYLEHGILVLTVSFLLLMLLFLLRFLSRKKHLV